MFIKDFYSEDEIIKLLVKTRKSDIFPAILLSSMLGLRRGEICGLTWDNVDFDNHKTKIHERMVTIKRNLITTTPKSTSSIRDLAFEDLCKQVLFDIKAK